MQSIISYLLTAPLSVAIGAYLARTITDETYDKNYVWWFFGFSVAASFAAAILSNSLLIGLLSACIITVSIYYKNLVFASAGYGVLVAYASMNSLYLLVVSFLGACAYFAYHKKIRELWILALLPTLISAILFLL